jgi:hypothetical protein
MMAMGQCAVAGAYLAFSMIDFNKDVYDKKYLKQLAP